MESSDDDYGPKLTPQEKLMQALNDLGPRLTPKETLMQALNAPATGGKKKRKKNKTKIKTENKYLEEAKKQRTKLSPEEEDENALKEEEDDNEDNNDEGEEVEVANIAYLDHELANEELMHLKGEHTQVAEISCLGSTEVAYFKRRHGDLDEAENIKKPIFRDQADDLEMLLTTTYNVVPFMAKNLCSLIDKHLDEHKMERKIAINFIGVVFNNYSLADLATSRPDRSKLYKLVYLTRALNIALKSRTIIKSNNKKLSGMSEDEQDQAEFRDRGYVRPTSLILLPFRNDALLLVGMMLELLNRDQHKLQVDYKKRFKDEFGGGSDDEDEQEKNKLKPADFKLTFEGSIDDDFKMGVQVSASKVRLYAPFYSSDLIIASPLGLRTIIGAVDEKHHEHDFLSSLQVVVADHTDVYLMQNWEHLLHIYQNLHMEPADSHNTDLFRIYTWALDGYGKHYCQHLLLSEVCNVQIASLATKYCRNYKGLLLVKPVVRGGAIARIPRPLPQIFHKMPGNSLQEINDARFNFFVNSVFADIRAKKITQVLVYVPQYYDFVRVRNHLRKKQKDAEGIEFRHISEYSQPKEASKARRKLVKGELNLMLYSERYHFFYRPYVKGIEHVVFYDLPTYPHYYSEICNMVKMNCKDQCSMPSVKTMYSSVNCMKLSAVLGDVNAEKLVRSEQDTNLFLTGISS